MRVDTGDLVQAAAAAGSAVGAFNVITLEHAEAIVAGAEQAGLPVILQVSENAVRFHLGQLRPLAAAIREIAAGARIPVALHLDHVTDAALLNQTADAGFSSVMFDASTLPYDENVTATRAAASWAHERGLWLEAELGEVGGKDGAHAPGVRTDPDEAYAYVAATGVDALAVAIGSSHAMTAREAVLDLELANWLHKHVPVPLVLHGSSGVPDDQLRGAVANGMAKINIGTALSVAYTAAIRGILTQPKPPVDPRKYLRPARDAVADKVAHLLTVLHQE
jgi:fructose-bisphosphate aldolase, class II